MIINRHDHQNLYVRRSGLDRRMSGSSNCKGSERRIVDRRKQIDKRKNIRYAVKDFVFVNLRSGSEDEVGQLVDIGKDGLALHYLENPEKSKEYTELGIYSYHIDFALENIQFKTVSNTEIVSNIPFSSIKIRRLCLHFENLMPEQESQLEYFLRNYTFGNA